MPALSRLASLVRNLVRRRRVDRDLDEELAAYIDLAAAENTERGADPAEARRRALAEMGGIEHVRVRVREQRAGYTLEALVQDLQLGWRLFARHWPSSLLAVATVAVGIGAATSVFAVVDGVLLQALPYPGADRLVFVGPTARDGRRHFSPPDFVEFVESASTFDQVCAIQGSGLATLSVGGQSSAVRMREVTANVLSVYGVEPLIGRALRPADEDALAFTTRADPTATLPPSVMLISHRLWLDRFGGGRAVLGQQVELDFQPFEIVGVMPPDFEILVPGEADYRASVDVIVPTRMDFRGMPRDAAFLSVVGRLNDGVTVVEARAEAGLFAARQRDRHAVHRESGYEVAIDPLGTRLASRHAGAIVMLFGAAAFLLLIACANLAGIVLTRAVTRQREFALRLALGAGRGRLARQLMAESSFYAMGGLALALPMAQGLLAGLVQTAPASIPRLGAVALGAPSVLFASACAVATTTMVSLLAGWRLTSPARVQALRIDDRTVAGARRRPWDRALVAGEVAVSVVLLVGTALLVTSVSRLLGVQPGFRAERVLTADVYLAERRYPRYPSPAARVQFARTLTERVSRLPGVESAALALVVPLGGQDAGHTYASEAIAASEAVLPPARYRPVTPDYFRAVGTRLLAGRDFDWADVEQQRLVSIVDRRLADATWPGEDAIGRRLRIERWSTSGGSIHLEPLWTEVVGVAENVRSADLGSDDQETVYLPYSLYAVAELSLLVRTLADPAQLSDPVRSELAAIDPDVPLLRLRAMDDIVLESLGPQRFSSNLLGVFGLAGLVLALIGVSAAFAHSVNLRRREIGVRMALGARPSDALRLVLAGGARVLAIGIALGLVAATGLSQLVAAQLYGVSPVDPAVYLAVAAVVLMAGLAACYLPARHASRIDPIRTLRMD